MVILVALWCLGKWMTVADWMGLQWVCFCNGWWWLGIWWLVVTDLYLQCLIHNNNQTLANILQQNILHLKIFYIKTNRALETIF